MEEQSYLRKLLKVAMPICFQAFMEAAVAAADAFMLGGVDQNLMAAVSLASQIQFIQNMILSAGVSATAVLGAQYWGRRNMDAMDDIFCICLRICGVLSILFCAGCMGFPRLLMQIYTNSETLIEIGASYLRIAGFSYLLTGISASYMSMMKVSDHVPTVAATSITTVLANVVLNAVLIYGFDMNADGAAYATLASRIIEVVIVLILSYRKGYLHPKLSRLFHYNKVLIRDFVRCMWPLLGASLLWGFGFTSYSSFMGHLGEDAAAANSVTAVVRDLVCCACDGLANGCGILVGNALGAGLLEVGRDYGKRTLKISFEIGFASTAVMLAAMPIVTLTVKLTDDARRYLWQMMIVMAVYMIGRAVNTILINGVFAAGGDTLFDVYSLVITMWGIAVPLAALGTYVFHWPPVVVYACTCLDEVGKIPWVVAHFRKYKWVKDMTRPEEEIAGERVEEAV